MVLDPLDVGVHHQLWVELVSFQPDAADGAHLSEDADYTRGVDAKAVDGRRQRAGLASAVIEAWGAAAEPRSAVAAETASLGECGLDGESSVLDLEGGEDGALTVLVVGYDRDAGGLGTWVDVDDHVLYGRLFARSVEQADAEQSLDVMWHGAALLHKLAGLGWVRGHQGLSVR